MSRYPCPRRNAFTLIEILVVLTIMAALAALVAGASVKFIEVQQAANTQSTLDRVQAVLVKNWSAHKDQIVKEKISNDATNPASNTHDWIYYNFCKGIDDANKEGRIRVIYLKLKQRQAFPMNFNEALFPPFGNFDPLGNPNPGSCPCLQLQPLPAYKTYLNSRGIGLSGGFGWESSACLLMALQRGVAAQSIDPSVLTSGGAGGVDDQGYGVPVLNDAWGRPIYFSRVPAGCPSLNPPQPNSATTILATGGICYALPKMNDPGDPQGYLQSPAWGTTYGGLFSSDTLQILAPPNYSYRFGPMVASGGPGKMGQPGFDPITFAPTPGGSAMFAK